MIHPVDSDIHLVNDWSLEFYKWSDDTTKTLFSVQINVVGWGQEAINLFSLGYPQERKTVTLPLKIIKIPLGYLRSPAFIATF